MTFVWCIHPTDFIVCKTLCRVLRDPSNEPRKPAIKQSSYSFIWIRSIIQTVICLQCPLHFLSLGFEKKVIFHVGHVAHSWGFREVIYFSSSYQRLNTELLESDMRHYSTKNYTAWYQLKCFRNLEEKAINECKIQRRVSGQGGISTCPWKIIQNYISGKWQQKHFKWGVFGRVIFVLLN